MDTIKSGDTVRSYDLRGRHQPRGENLMIRADQAPLVNHNDVRRYLLGGRGSFTIENPATQGRFTFSISRPKDPDPNAPYFVKVLTGPDNTSSYAYLGQFWDNAGTLAYAHGKRSRIGPDAPSAIAARWFFHHLNEGSLPKELGIYHEGVCCRCGRKLTTPESIRTGIGPVCAGKASC